MVVYHGIGIGGNNVRGVISHDRAAQHAWDLMKSISFRGKEYESIDEIDPMIKDILERYNSAKANKTSTTGILPELNFGDGGKRRGKPWAEMARARKAGGDYNKIFASLPGFTNPETEMLPTVVNWIGGKTQIAPQLRALSQMAGKDKIPAELFGGSGSYILGMNQGRGLYGDINPDMTNLMTQLQQGMGDVNIAQDYDDQVRMMNELNEIRYRRDVMGEKLDDDDLMRLAHLLVGSNLQYRDGMFSYEDWGEKPAVPYTEGKIKIPNAEGSFRSSSVRYMPHDVGSINLDPYAARLKDVDIHTGDLRQTSEFLTPQHTTYLDPPYQGRDISYGGSAEQLQGKTFDDLQRDTLRIASELEGPVIYSNYMYDKDGEPMYNLIDAAQDADMTIHPWLRKPKGNKEAKVEMIGLRNFPNTVDMSEMQRRLF